MIELESSEESSGSLLRGLILPPTAGATRRRALLHLRAKLIAVTRPLIMKKVFTARVAFRTAWRRRDEQDSWASEKRLSGLFLRECECEREGEGCVMLGDISQLDGNTF